MAGRPNKAKSKDDYVIFSMRINEGLRQKLKAEAVKNHRTLASEMVHRLAASVQPARRTMEAAE